MNKIIIFLFLTMMKIFPMNPMTLLASVMLYISCLIFMNFIIFMDYWLPFLLTLSFLVGLFMIFNYLVSLNNNSIKENAWKTNYSKNFFFLAILLFPIMTNFFSNFEKVNTNSLNSMQNFEWLFETPNEIIIMCMFFFALFMAFLFFFMKKNKKAMKSAM